MNRKPLAYAIAAAVPLGMSVPSSHLKPAQQADHSGQQWCAAFGCGPVTIALGTAACYLLELSPIAFWACKFTFVC
jgi:hypothetical protein